MQEAGRQGAFIEFVYHGTLGANSRLSLVDYARAMKEVGVQHCIMSTDLGDVPPNTNYPIEPVGFQRYIEEMNKLGLSVAEINQMSKTNPALALGLTP